MSKRKKPKKVKEKPKAKAKPKAKPEPKVKVKPKPKIKPKPKPKSRPEPKAVGILMNYRLGPRTQRPKEYLLRFLGIDSTGKAAPLIGKKVVWYTKKDVPIMGKIIGTHGNKGTLLARFNKGLPGIAIGTKVDLL